MDIYISYKSEYRDYARWIKSKLTNLGISVWLDVDEIKSGEYFRQAIQIGLDEAQVLILLVTQEVLASREVMSEVDYILLKGKPVIPIIIGNAQMPYSLSTLQYFDFRNDRERAFDRFVDSLKRFDLLVKDISNSGEKIYINNQVEGEKILKTAHDMLEANSIDEAIAQFVIALEYMQNDQIRLSALQALGNLRANNAAILRTLQDPSVDVRKEAILALTKIKSQESKLALQISSLQDTSMAVRLYASTALLIYDNPESIPNWLNELSANSKNPKLNEAITGLQLRISEIITNAPKHVFISYSRSDSETFSISLADNLRNSGYSVWIDTNLELGSPVWMHDIEKAIQQAGVCLVVLSPAIHNSQWVPKEVEFARQFDKKIIPIKYRQTHKPLYLSTEQGLRTDLPFDTNYKIMYALLAESLQKFISRIQ